MQPTPASSVNRLRWYIEQAVPAGGSGTVSFQTTVNTGTPNFTRVNNEAIIKIGTGPVLGRASDEICVGACAPATISGQVRDDVDADGNLADAESGIPGVQIQLWTDPNGDGNPTDGELVTATSTNSSGNYSFTNLLPGSYVVVETNLVGWVSTADKLAPNAALAIREGGISPTWVRFSLPNDSRISGHSVAKRCG